MNVGVDIGGSHIGIGLVDSEGTVLKKIEKDIMNEDRKDIKSFIRNIIISTIGEWLKDYDIKKIGIGVPGTVVDDIIKYSFNLNIYDYDLKSQIVNKFPNISVSIKNDAKCAALAEKKIGALRAFDDCIFICLGTGIGGAAFYNGEIIEPRLAPGFEFGHMVIDFKSQNECKCGNKGCFEVYVSFSRFKLKIQSILNLTGNCDGEQIHRALKDNLKDKKVDEAINDYIKALSIGLSNIVNILEPQAICIGGGFTHFEDILLERLEQEFYNSNYIFYKDQIPEIKIAKLKNDAGIIGSALYT